MLYPVDHSAEAGLIILVSANATTTNNYGTGWTIGKQYAAFLFKPREFQVEI